MKRGIEKDILIECSLVCCGMEKSQKPFFNLVKELNLRLRFGSTFAQDIKKKKMRMLMVGLKMSFKCEITCKKCQHSMLELSKTS